jgi:hypothetical protein
MMTAYPTAAGPWVRLWKLWGCSDGTRVAAAACGGRGGHVGGATSLRAPHGRGSPDASSDDYCGHQTRRCGSGWPGPRHILTTGRVWVLREAAAMASGTGLAEGVPAGAGRGGVVRVNDGWQPSVLVLLLRNVARRRGPRRQRRGSIAPRDSWRRHKSCQRRSSASRTPSSRLARSRRRRTWPNWA